MKAIKIVTTSNAFIGINKKCVEQLPSGASIEKAILMGSKSCCGAAYENE